MTEKDLYIEIISLLYDTDHQPKHIIIDDQRIYFYHNDSSKYNYFFCMKDLGFSIETPMYIDGMIITELPKIVLKYKESIE